MTSIGERLQQARQQQNLSLEAIAQKLNIGSDILSKFETNDFSCQLPPIYNRGFLLTYAKFLHLNTAEIATLYDQLTEGGKEIPPTPLKHLQFDASESMEAGPPEESLKSSAFLRNHRQWKLPPFNQKQWIAIGIVALLGFFLLLKGCHSSGAQTAESHLASDSSEPPLEDSQTFFESESHAMDAFAQQSTEPIVSSMEPIVEERLTLIASDTVKIVVRRERDQKTLFSGTLHGGAQQSIEKKETLQILFSNGDHFTIARANGTLVRPQTAGRGLVRIQ